MKTSRNSSVPTQPRVWVILPGGRGVQNCPWMRNTALIFRSSPLELCSPNFEKEHVLSPSLRMRKELSENSCRKLHFLQGNYSTTSYYLSTNSVFGRLRVGLAVCGIGFVGVSDTVDLGSLWYSAFPNSLLSPKQKENHNPLSINLSSGFKQNLWLLLLPFCP